MKLIFSGSEIIKKASKPAKNVITEKTRLHKAPEFRSIIKLFAKTSHEPKHFKLNLNLVIQFSIIVFCYSIKKHSEN